MDLSVNVRTEIPIDKVCSMPLVHSLPHISGLYTLPRTRGISAGKQGCRVGNRHSHAARRRDGNINLVYSLLYIIIYAR
jgi:hypothetical protein